MQKFPHYRHLIQTPFPYQLYLVTDEAACLGRDFYWVVEEALKGGIDLLQLREKTLPRNTFSERGKRVKDLCSKYGVPLIINDVIQVAKEVGAYGLHLGQKDEPISHAKNLLGIDYPIGISLEIPSQLNHPQIESAWYLGVSPIYPTPTKKDTISVWGLEGLQKLRKMTHLPLVAIGGIQLSNAQMIIRSGADCLAVVSGICSADQPAVAAENLKREIEKAKT
ncbi:MAG: thiamine phosphate synthase [Cyclobacteriaceae bacterium]